jgi:Flp pilus assembly pilin Flp
MLRLAVQLQNAIAGLKDSLMDRARDERGQTAAEYLGIIVVVAAIIIAIVGQATGISQKVVSGIGRAIDKIANN